ncbi:MAG: hydroxyacid dehydrogenase, partial [Firmicutes bacterium]|nr:hydroxyacid dehydrogenase [Bacillota bacterium]
MKVALIGCAARKEKYGADVDTRGAELIALDPFVTPAEIAKKAADAEYAVIDAILPFTAEMMDAMPKLRMIHSEGVSINKIDVKAATERGIIVCSNKGINAVSVAEHTLTLIMAVTKKILPAYKAVMYGRQIETKTEMINAGIREFSEYSFGMIGFGDIARELARMMQPLGIKVYYTDIVRPAPEIEEKYNVTYLERDELISTCDIVSLHVPVLPSTENMVNREFLSKMKTGAYLINTARGELMVNEDVIEALRIGKLAGAAFDTIAPEPVLADNPWLAVDDDIKDKIIITPHIAGVT